MSMTVSGVSSAVTGFMIQSPGHAFTACLSLDYMEVGPVLPSNECGIPPMRSSEDNKFPFQGAMPLGGLYS